MRKTLVTTLGLALGLGIGSCGVGQTTLLVQVVSDDVRVPADVDTISINVHGQASGHDLMSGMESLPGPFPQSYLIHAAPGFESETVHLTVTAFRSTAFSIRRVLDATMVAGTSTTVVVRLERCCLGLRCGTGIDCSSCLCQTNVHLDGGVSDAGSCTNAAQCDDHVTCTVDTCVMGQCMHMANDSMCPTGQVCDPLAAAHAALDGGTGDAGTDAAMPRDAAMIDAATDGGSMDAGRDAGPPSVDAAAPTRSGCAVPCRSDSDCDDGMGCTGRRYCLEGRCGAMAGTPCVLSNAVSMCSNGMCAIASCNAGFGDCDGVAGNGCETMLNSAMHCGACTATCSFPNASASCAAGTCTQGVCIPGFADCNGPGADGCETATTTVANCGGCAMACTVANGTGGCATGTCGIAGCNPGHAHCTTTGHDCETPLNTNTDCGACGAACTTMNGSPTCTTGACAVASCNSGYGHCVAAGHDCETQLNSLTNCAMCGAVCNLPNAVSTCTTGACAIVSCNTGFADCDHVASNGCEAQLNTLTNCGACGIPCAVAMGTPTCATGTCQINSCNLGYANCGTGCIPLNTLTNCGGCGTSCAVMNGTATCGTGSCAIMSCNPGYGHCTAVGHDCETHLNTLANCGGCGTACSLPNAAATCATGSCAIQTCNPGYGDCDGIASNGCEAPLNTTANCGACGTTCATLNGTATCATGTCAVASCSPGYGHCSAIGHDCETRLNTATNCGGCGVACGPLANATASCATGSCAVTSCSAGFGNCDGIASNGCEAPLNTTTNCGGCGVACGPYPNSTETCATGTCAIATCAAGFGHCTIPVTNGCETPLTTTANCGGCGVACGPYPNSTESCATGTCAIASCNPGYGHCTGPVTNGCETPLNTLANCSGCGVTCSFANASSSCATGACALVSCNPGYAHCTGPVSGGCETPTTTVANCGSCGVPCTIANGTGTCATGSCALASCNASYHMCAGACASNMSIASCGATSCTACPTYPNTTATCDGTNCGTACTANFVHCSTVMTAGCECAGTQCCTGACQPVHQTGVPASPNPGATTTYELMCVALGTPGNETTYTQAMATQACAAYTGSITQCSASQCGGGSNATHIVCDFGNTLPSCTCWTYTGPGAGTVIQNPGTTCLCANSLGAGTWN